MAVQKLESVETRIKKFNERLKAAKANIDRLVKDVTKRHK